MPKRDLETIRALLLKAEGIPLDSNDEFNTGVIDLMNQISSSDGYHLILMRDAGLIEGRDAGLGLFRITSAGYDYLDAIRSEGIWMQTKAVVAKQGGNVTLELVKAISVGFVKKQIELHTGIVI
jgi:hypothetical protein